ncbi:hypothetical protein [Empedobacter brevis]|uniref:hypothetical protein n=1 Tax=Empedobacter brevis TaxID=247 RepID=UPI0033414363
MKLSKTNMNFLLCIMSLAFLCSGCGTYEKIGNFKYRTKTEMVFTGDYGGIVKELKSYQLKNKHQAGVVLKSQLGFKPIVDTIYSVGFTEIDKINKRLIIKEYYFYGYKDAIRKDSVLKVFQQAPTGELNLLMYKTFYKGGVSDKGAP